MNVHNNLPRTIKQKRTGPEQRAEQAQLEMVAQSSTSRKREAIKYLKVIDQEEGKTTPTLPCCATCGTPKTTRRPLNACSQCHTTHYCNRDCQMTHWKAGHKRACKQLQKEHEKKLAAAGGLEK